MLRLRRLLWFRTLATLVAAWLPLVSGEPGLLQPCPMHGAEGALIATLRGEPVPAMGGTTLAALGTDAGATGTAHPAAHANHSHGAAAMEHGHSTPSSSHDQHTCSCIDGCAVSVIAFAAPAPPAAPVGGAVYAVAGALTGVESFARPAPHFARPYTTGPPRA